jgi:hypothetical protein
MTFPTHEIGSGGPRPGAAALVTGADYEVTAGDSAMDI